jgi:hypothetical protein
MARNGEMLSGCCCSGGGTGMLMAGIGAGVVGLCVAGLPLRHHLRTSLTLATTERVFVRRARGSEGESVPENIVIVNEGVSV